MPGARAAGWRLVQSRVSFGLSRGRDLDPTGIEVPAEAIPPLPDDILSDPRRGWVDPRAWFADPARPIELEIGSGKGTFLLGAAGGAPGVNHIGVEYAREFFLYAADRVRRSGLANVRMLCADAGEFVRWRLPTGCVSVVHLYFPDPWPKAKHHRRRMISDRFLGDCARVLRPGGELRVVTDHAGYWAWMEDHFARWSTLFGDQSPGPEDAARVFVREPFSPPATARDGELVGTNFERKYRQSPGSGGGGTEFFAAVLRLRGGP